MKFFLLAGMLAATFEVQAENIITETMTMKTPNGQFVRIGDTEATLLKKMQQSPKPRLYTLNNGKLNCPATEYTYRLNVQEYKVTLCYSLLKNSNQIVKIQWRNLEAKELIKN